LGIESDKMVKMETIDGITYLIVKRDEADKIRIVDVYGERGMTSNDVVYKDNHIIVFIIPKNAKLVDRR